MTLLRFFTLLLVSLMFAVSFAQNLDIGGELSTTAGVSFDHEKSLLSLSELDLVVSGEVGLGFFPDASFKAVLHSEFDAAAGQAELDLGEAYATLYIEDVDLVVGQQIVAWGSTDGFNPVDVLNPKDFRAGFVGAEKLALPMIRATYTSPEDIKLDGVVIPAFRASRLANLPLKLPSEGLPPGASIVGLEPADERLPDMTLENLQFAARATFPLDILEGGDLSASYVHGIATRPTFSVKLKPVSAQNSPQQTPTTFTAQPVLTYTKYDLIGVDFSVAALGTVFRAEAAYTITADSDGTDPEVNNHSFQAVFGSEYSFDNGPTASLQGILDYLAADAGKDADWAFSTVFNLRYEANNRTDLSAIWLQNFSDGSGVFVPGLSYTFADGVTGEVRLSGLYGADGSQFGALRDSSRLSLSLAYAF